MRTTYINSGVTAMNTWLRCRDEDQRNVDVVLCKAVILSKLLYEMASVNLEHCSPTLRLNDIKNEEEEKMRDLSNQDGIPEVETFSTFGEKQHKDYKESALW
ncbi:hypothetical protein DPEC_G00320580 [Dallia pectoralis]|uniref:Uncharacterized protein n=1 Tax=Dallia pectoralis TaxID=75939 RepID=A0ACC2FA27_DALPE|nr:hypothetical protein DPEC_G00320580 [Dallia pectoralis]